MAFGRIAVTAENIAVQHTPVRVTLRRLIRENPGLKQGFFVTLVLALLSAGGSVSIALITQIVIDHRLLQSSDLAALIWLLMGATVLIVVTAYFSYLVTKRLVSTGERELALLRIKAFRRVHEHSILTINSTRTGSVIGRVTSDVDQLSTFLPNFISVAVKVVHVLVALGLMAWYNIWLALITIVCLLPILPFLAWMQRRLQQGYSSERARVADMITAFSEFLHGLPLMRVFGVTGFYAEKARHAVHEKRQAEWYADKVGVSAAQSTQLFVRLITVVILGAGTAMGVAGKITLGELAAFLFLVTLLINPVSIMAQMLNDLQNALAAGVRVLDLVQSEVEVEESTCPLPIPSGPHALGAENITFAYPDGTLAVTDFSVNIAPGTAVAIVGATGSGKSTMARLFTRLVDPTSGNMLIGGQNMRALSRFELRRLIGYLPQEGHLFSGSVAHNLRYARPEASDQEVLAAFTQLGLHDWVQGLPQGIDTEVGVAGAALSVGERQLVALARLAILDPEIVVLDEATSALDPGTDVMVSSALQKLVSGRTSITIAHRLATAIAAERILVLENGHLVQDGAHQDLVQVAGPYARLHADWVNSSQSSN